MSALPQQAKDDMYVWWKTNKPTAVCPVKPINEFDCPECGGLGTIPVKFLKAGPFRHVPDSRSVLTSRGTKPMVADEWWIVDHTNMYPCTACRGGTATRLAGNVIGKSRTEIQQMFKDLADDKDIEKEPADDR